MGDDQCGRDRFILLWFSWLAACAHHGFLFLQAAQCLVDHRPWNTTYGAQLRSIEGMLAQQAKIALGFILGKAKLSQGLDQGILFHHVFPLGSRSAPWWGRATHLHMLLFPEQKNNTEDG